MKFEAFRKEIDTISEQLYIEREGNNTKVLWVYAGFDMLEEMRPKNEKEPSVRKKITNFLNDGDKPKYHTVAIIAEDKEYVVKVDVSSKYVPESIRRNILQPIAEYVTTPLLDRHPIDNDIIVKTPKETNKDGDK